MQQRALTAGTIPLIRFLLRAADDSTTATTYVLHHKHTGSSFMLIAYCTELKKVLFIYWNGIWGQWCRGDYEFRLWIRILELDVIFNLFSFLRSYVEAKWLWVPPLSASRLCGIQREAKNIYIVDFEEINYNW